MTLVADSPVLEIERLTKWFSVGGLFSSKRLRALAGASLALHRREIVALVGESGSGKSTIARIMARLLAPSSGRILLDGKDVLASEPRRASLAYRRRIQMIFQDPFGSLNSVHTIAHHLERPLLLHGKARGHGELHDSVRALLATVDLDADVAMKHPYELSGGQRQRVAIARALAVDPDVLLADEPISMLDVSIRAGVLNLMERLKEERGLAELYITHDVASARYLADRTLVMYAGYIVEGAPSDELIASPAHPYTRTLLAAVPDPGARGSPASGLPAAKGGAAALVNPPPGCPFASRCPDVMEACRREMPGVEQVGPNHWVRCHLVGPGGSPSGPDPAQGEPAR